MRAINKIINNNYKQGYSKKSVSQAYNKSKSWLLPWCTAVVSNWDKTAHCGICLTSKKINWFLQLALDFVDDTEVDYTSNDTDSSPTYQLVWKMYVVCYQLC